ncbi:putative SOS response-associated peptidase YedK [Microbacterium sp. AK009]|uniref:SOS response-associated peptidase n=1 Tax=Microbacterium sp. AK009 TaxID=2723068 RepID=UPI0015CC67A8|nr:SOS response-associated peptidase [Microbacterium sp. AK009]NYF17069.1 putative SOS response-associated peptidase YedK [Microbacterium sp. AK009]
MCGRFVVANVGSELVGVLRVDVESDDLPAPSYNIAPTSSVAIVLDSAKTEPPTRRLEPARWGLVPGWAKDVKVGARAFNARSEELEDKPMFRQALAKRRAIVPATGYYEWEQVDGAKIPHYIHPAGGEPLFFGGLYEWWKDPSKQDDDPARWLLSFTILTRDSIGRLGSIHDRMPLFMDPDHADAWLDPTTENVRDVLDAAIDAAPAVAETLEDHEVDRAVGNVRNNGPHLIEPADSAAPADHAS